MDRAGLRPDRGGQQPPRLCFARSNREHKHGQIMSDLARFVAVICVVAFAMSAMGQSVDQYDRLLLPLTTGQVPGAFGSIWKTDIALTNLSDSPLTVVGFQQRGGCPILCGPQPPIPPHATIFPDVVASACPEVRGVLLWVERGRVGDLDVALRTHDLSRQNETWGTTIPVISVDELFERRFGLADVPMDRNSGPRCVSMISTLLRPRQYESAFTLSIPRAMSLATP